MEDRLPWPRGTAAAALGFVIAAWCVGFALLWFDNTLGWLALAIAAWLTAGLIYSVLRGPASAVSEGLDGSDA